MPLIIKTKSAKQLPTKPKLETKKPSTKLNLNAGKTINQEAENGSSLDKTADDLSGILDDVAAPKQETNSDILDSILLDDAKPADERGETTPLDKPDSLETDLHYEDQPEEMGSKWASKVKRSLEVIEEELHKETVEKERISEAMRSVLIGMREDPATVEILADEDMGRMVRALRLTYSTTLATKQANKGKKKATAAKVDDAAQALAGIDLGF